jgi:hypothetical protein
VVGFIGFRCLALVGLGVLVPLLTGGL